ncbi:hypothetical protein P7C73_g6834, partial [Tremellales sp. Uapishka_1]
MSSSANPLFPISSATATSTSDLFPGASPTSTSSSSSGGVRPDVYYLVFLGVLVVLVFMAACLGLRAMRLRRRYRTATQRAIANGDPVPPNWNVFARDNSEFWGVGGFAAFTADGLDRFGAPRTDRRGDKARLRVPMMWEAQVEEKAEEEEEEEE